MHLKPGIFVECKLSLLGLGNVVEMGSYIRNEIFGTTNEVEHWMPPMNTIGLQSVTLSCCMRVWESPMRTTV